TVGIQGYWENPTYYLEYSCNTASLHNDLAICFTYPGSPGCIFGMDVPWVWEEPVSGTVPAESSLGVAVTVTSYLTEPLPLGTYTATLTVSSNAGEGTQYVPVVMHIIAEGVAPTAAFESNSPVALGETAVFTFTGDLGLPPATQFVWNFGDGYTSTLKNPTHVYEAVGVYTVTLEVCNVGGCDTAAGSFEVVWPFHIYLPIVTKGHNP
ncbi:MAG: PKD domain-containing protein, partial [Chloroflexia bacterium]